MKYLAQSDSSFWWSTWWLLIKVRMVIARHWIDMMAGLWGFRVDRRQFTRFQWRLFLPSHYQRSPLALFRRCSTTGSSLWEPVKNRAPFHVRDNQLPTQHQRNSQSIRSGIDMSIKLIRVSISCDGIDEMCDRYEMYQPIFGVRDGENDGIGDGGAFGNQRR